MHSGMRGTHLHEENIGVLILALSPALTVRLWVGPKRTRIDTDLLRPPSQSKPGNPISLSLQSHRKVFHKISSNFFLLLLSPPFFSAVIFLKILFRFKYNLFSFPCLATVLRRVGTMQIVASRAAFSFTSRAVCAGAGFLPRGMAASRLSSRCLGIHTDQAANPSSHSLCLWRETNVFGSVTVEDSLRCCTGSQWKRFRVIYVPVPVPGFESKVERYCISESQVSFVVRYAISNGAVRPSFVSLPRSVCLSSSLSLRDYNVLSTTQDHLRTERAKEREILFLSFLAFFPFFLSFLSFSLLYVGAFS